ncbi:MAG: tetratricopeptide repeat protein [Candidatus Aminicenantes bacterium]|nr:tetratricopeptide repeat protein [Candidatus Aminicenantes bacterium]
MVQSINEPDFFAKINKIVSYFSRTSKGGFLFCSCDKTVLINEIIKIILERAQLKSLKIKVLDAASANGERFLRMVKAAAGEKPDGVILSHLDEAIVFTKDQIIKDINLSRDILLGLKLPFLFCVTTGNIAKFANQAQDLFLRRDRGVIHFPNVPGITGSEIQGFMGELAEFGLQDMVEAESLNLKVGLLEKQLKEAIGKKYSPDRIANEIVLDLIKLYLSVSRVDEANQLFERYRPYFNLKNHLKTIITIGNLFKETSRLSEALDLFFKAKQIQEQTGDRTGRGVIFHYIGSVYYKKGELNKALENLLESMKIFDKAGETLILGSIILRISSIYKRKNNFNKFFEYLLRAKDVIEKIGNPNLIKFIDGIINQAKMATNKDQG